MDQKKNLLQLTEQEARAYLETIRWPFGPVCPKCKKKDAVSRVGGVANGRGLLHCRTCRKQFTVTVGTIFEGSHIPLNKWVMAFHLVCSSKKGMSALQLQRMTGLGSYKSAFHMAHRIRWAMRTRNIESKLSGEIEMDETYVGGKFIPGKRGRGAAKKTPVVAMIQRGGDVHATVINGVNQHFLMNIARKNAEQSSVILTDEFAAYPKALSSFKGHFTCRHKGGQYVNGLASTNTAESFFSLLKRGIYGSFHHVSPKHLPRYVDEFSFRWNTRDTTDRTRTAIAIKCSEGKRLSYRASSKGS